jgi:predicted nucleic acid-binding protein
VIPDEVAKRVAALQELEILAVTTDIRATAQMLLARKALPARAQSDAIHLACASHENVDILVTWNMRHLANPMILPRVRDIMLESGLHLPEICTPQVLLGSHHGK